MGELYITYNNRARQNRPQSTNILCDWLGMEPKDRLSLARQRAGYKSRSAVVRALRHINLNTLNSNENGNRAISKEMAAVYAEAFGVTAGWILYGEGEGPSDGPSPEPRPAPPKPATSPPPPNTPNASQPEPADFSVTVPVYGQVVGGSEGYFVFNGERLDDILAPSSLRGIKDAYAVYVAGTSMEPRYFAGEAVFVNPRRPVRPGDFVVVQVLEGNEHNHELHCYVKQYKGQKNGDYLFWQFNPNQEVKFPKDHVSKIHKIIGTGEG